MSMIQTNVEAVLVAIPMVGILAVVHFRLDELIGRTRKQPAVHRRMVGGSDHEGLPICVDPDGIWYRGERRTR